MSAGDVDNDAFSVEAVMAEFKNDAALTAYVQSAKYIDTQYDIPFVGGISNDGKTAYLDRHFPRHGTLSTGPIDFGYYIGNGHEAPEWYMVVMHGWSYVAAHHFANGVENMMVTAAGHKPREYNAYIDRFIPKIEREQVLVTPANLATYPYSTDKRLLRIIRERAA